eukprot:gb/GECH01014577.1/.p1 GENE.gb/GECH01014577.1/~~gb/GECH01014577.1/.p1  ORF type:complete len:389 (+),score=150.90 gb/GECH01014577.1/:1-1167(+)
MSNNNDIPPHQQQIEALESKEEEVQDFSEVLDQQRKAKECLKDEKFEEAVDIYSNLLSNAVEIFGELSFETADLYFEYAKALFQQLKHDTHIIANFTIKKVLAMKEKDQKQSQSESESESQDDKNKSENGEEEKDPVLMAQAEEEEAEAREKEEELAELQDLTFSCLDSARIAYSKIFDDLSSKPEYAFQSLMIRDWAVKQLAQVYRKLGEFGGDVASYEQAFSDYGKALELSHEYDLGLESEIYIEMGLLKISNREFDEGIEMYQKTKQELKKRIDKKQKSTKKDQELIEDIEDRMKSFEQFKDQHDKTIQQEEPAQQVQTTAPDESSEDINLLKPKKKKKKSDQETNNDGNEDSNQSEQRKRKRDNESDGSNSVEEPPAKKVKTNE